MSNTLIIIIGIVCIVAFIFLSKAFIYNKWANRCINLLLFISLFFLPDSIACICFALLVVRLGIWLFGPAQDMQDDYRYTRYRNARNRYEEKMHKQRMDLLYERKKRNTEERRKQREKEQREQTQKIDIMFSDNYKKMMSDYSKKITDIETLTKDDMYYLMSAYKKAILSKDNSMINKLQNINSKDDITNEIKKYFKEKGV